MENTMAEQQEMKQWCESHKNRYVLVQTHDGWCCDGFIEHIDDEIVCIAVPCGTNEWENRAFLPYASFGAPIYPYPYYPRRRFIRQVFPLAALLAITLLPFF
ncbi:hypothetical protein [Paenibacillus sp. sgz302251]|uniref:hypothetical protein n=1 Tax=Paenibacillus sp. sgz302251 TaxID=3414493 RepID=UPI003C7CD943